jgi:signal transduction histidine kinase
VNGLGTAPEARSEVEDPRVAAVLDVLRGHTVAAAADEWQVDPDVLTRWVSDFVCAGTAQVTNRPHDDSARQRDRFLAAFAHEVRTPLTVARGWVTMLSEGQVPPTQVAHSMRRLDQALDRLAERSRDVELMAAASLGRLVLEPEQVTALELLDAVVPPDCVSGADVVLDVDVEKVRRVVRDLWEAAALSPAPRSRRVEVAVVGPWVEVRVVREADPIHPEVLRALFEPFDANDDGTGVTLGLYLARALSVAHGGSVGLEQDDDRAALWVRIPVGTTTPPRTPLEEP